MLFQTLQHHTYMDISRVLLITKSIKIIITLQNVIIEMYFIEKFKFS